MGLMLSNGLDLGLDLYLSLGMGQGLAQRLFYNHALLDKYQELRPWPFPGFILAGLGKGFELDFALGHPDLG